MKIAFTHNLQLSASEEEAEFDTPETVRIITEALLSLGHEVEPVEVSGPASRTVARLEALNPDLIFNTAEGKNGRYREAFFPGLFEQLGIPYTGSDAYVCALTLDKQMTKLSVAAHGIPTPRWVFVDQLNDWKQPELNYPVMVKPNFEGSSKGITKDSVVEHPAQLFSVVKNLLERYPQGLLIEEYIVGDDVAVPFLEKASPATHGILPAAQYVYSDTVKQSRKFQIYDYHLKQVDPDSVDVRVPAQLPESVLHNLQDISARAFKTLGVRDAGRIDYRVTPEGKIYFIEVNALPSLEVEASIYKAARLVGLPRPADVLHLIIESACARQGLKNTPSPKRIKPSSLRVGLTYNLKRVEAKTDTENDAEAEFDAPTTIHALRDAIASFGHTVIELEATPELTSILPAANVDVVFNIAEGLRGRNREAQIPALLELLNIPYTGSDPATLSLALDKGLAKRMIREAGFNTPQYFSMMTGKERVPKNLAFPLIVKPMAEGSSKGVLGASVVENEDELRALAKRMIDRYRQPAIIEEYLPGREFTVALLGEKRPKVLPPMEVVFTKTEKQFKVYSFQHKLDQNQEIRYEAPAQVDAALRKELERVAKGCFTALGCRDVARIDLRLDAQGRVHFIECNPLPGLTPGWSDLCLIAESAGMDYRTLIGDILAPAIQRFREKQRMHRAELAEWKEKLSEPATSAPAPRE